MDKKAELTNGENLRYRTSLPDIFISVCIALIKDGYSVSGQPNASHIYMVGTFSNWEEKPAYKLKRLKNGSWEIKLPIDAIQHGDLYKLHVYWEGGQGERIPCLGQSGSTR